jgi:hypothetical protein
MLEADFNGPVKITGGQQVGVSYILNAIEIELRFINEQYVMRKPETEKN